MYEVRDPLDRDRSRGVHPARVVWSTTQHIARSWWLEFRALFAAVALYLCAVALVLDTAGISALRVLAGDPARFADWLTVTAYLLAVGAARVWLQHADGRPLQPVLARLPGALTIAGLIIVVAVIFSAWKQAMPHIAPYTWDAQLHAVSVALHGGPEWRCFTFVYDSPRLLQVLDTFYLWGWGTASMIATGVLAWHDDATLRRRYLWTLLLSWIGIGSCAALMFGSGGPVFYGVFVDGVNPYADLLERLPETLTSSQVAGELERAYRTQSWRLGVGISAFPSMHVSQATLVALLAWQTSRRWLFLVSVIFVALTVLGSVVLAWHYAVDGYAAIILTVGIWIAVSQRDGKRSCRPSGEFPREGGDRHRQLRTV